MLKKEKIVEATRYNSGKIGKLWRIEDLPYPLCEKSGAEFVAWVCVFQHENRMSVDGKMGPRTYEEAKLQKKLDDNFYYLDSEKNGPSNCVIMNGKRHRLPEDMIEQGYTAKNFLDDGLEKFKSKKREHALKHFVLHETCGNTSIGCENTLRRKGYGVQLIQDHEGCFYNYGDLVLDQMVHANQLNKSSFGCEQVNPYSPIYVKDGRIWNKWIKREWWTWVPSSKTPGVDKLLERKGWKSVPKQYVCLTDKQVESMKLFSMWVCEKIKVVPYAFPTQGMKRNEKIKYPNAGIVAHQDFAGHADGRYMLEILIQEQLL